MVLVGGFLAGLAPACRMGANGRCRACRQAGQHAASTGPVAAEQVVTTVRSDQQREVGRQFLIAASDTSRTTAAAPRSRLQPRARSVHRAHHRGPERSGAFGLPRPSYSRLVRGQRGASHRNRLFRRTARDQHATTCGAPSGATFAVQAGRATLSSLQFSVVSLQSSSY
jgi:hypothetical protein